VTHCKNPYYSLPTLTDTLGRVFSEETRTVVLSRHDAGILSKHKIAPDESLSLPSRAGHKRQQRGGGPADRSDGRRRSRLHIWFGVCRPGSRFLADRISASSAMAAQRGLYVGAGAPLSGANRQATPSPPQPLFPESLLSLRLMPPRLTCLSRPPGLRCGGLSFRSRKTYAVGSSIELAAPYAPGSQAIFVRARIQYAMDFSGVGLFRYGAAYVPKTVGNP
jgi:hypothetical protein